MPGVGGYTDREVQNISKGEKEKSRKQSRVCSDFSCESFTCQGERIPYTINQIWAKYLCHLASERMANLLHENGSSPYELVVKPVSLTG